MDTAFRNEKTLTRMKVSVNGLNGGQKSMAMFSAIRNGDGASA